MNLRCSVLVFTAGICRCGRQNVAAYDIVKSVSARKVVTVKAVLGQNAARQIAS